MPTQTKTVAPTISPQSVKADAGYKLTEVEVGAVTNNIDSNIKAENIKKNVTILGVTGTLETSSGETTNVLEEYNVTMYTDENGYNVLALDNKTSAEKNYVVGQLIKNEQATLYLVNA